MRKLRFSFERKIRKCETFISLASEISQHQFGTITIGSPAGRRSPQPHGNLSGVPPPFDDYRAWTARSSQRFFVACMSRLQIPDASYAIFEVLIERAMSYMIVQRTRRYDMKIGNRIGEFLQLRKAYRDLSRLDDAALKDIGVTRGDIKRLVYGR